jgi:hypothetical protein
MFRDLAVYRAQKVKPPADVSALSEVAAASGELPPPTRSPPRSTGWPLETSMGVWKRAQTKAQTTQIAGNLPIYPFIVGDVGTRSLSEYRRLLGVKAAVAEWNTVLDLICAQGAAHVVSAACVAAEGAWEAIDRDTALGTTGTTRPMVVDADSRLLALQTLRHAIAPMKTPDLHMLKLALRPSSLVDRARVISRAAVAQTTNAIEAACAAQKKLEPGALQLYVNYVSLAIEWRKHCDSNDVDEAQQKTFLLHSNTLASGHMPKPTWSAAEAVTSTILAWTNST